MTDAFDPNTDRPVDRNRIHIFYHKTISMLLFPQRGFKLAHIQYLHHHQGPTISREVRPEDRRMERSTFDERRSHGRRRDQVPRVHLGSWRYDGREEETRLQSCRVLQLQH